MNASFSIVLTLIPRINLPVNSEHHLNVKLPIFSKEFPIMREPFKFLQPLKAKSPIYLTESGITKSPVICVKSLNASSSIISTFLPIISFLKLLHPVNVFL